MNITASENCYVYYSNGADYKLLDWGITDMTLEEINENPIYKDPARNDHGFLPPCNMNDASLVLAIYSPGARCW
jgi:hypothetical protein